MIQIHTTKDWTDIPQGAVVSVGMFDGVHLGHRRVLASLCRFAEELGAVPMAITFDSHPRLVLGAQDNDFRLLTTNAERYAIMEQGGIADVLEIHFTPDVAALSACQFTEEFLVRRLAVKGLLLGYDNMFGNKSRNDFDALPQLARKSGFGIRYEGSLLYGDIAISSTQIRKALASGNLLAANNMLGYQYSMEGIVVEGRKVGRTIGFPTANILPSDTLKMLPADGVYITLFSVEGQRYRAICNVGAQPTFNAGSRTVEAHILDFCGDIYGKTVTVAFLERLRDIKRFDTPQSLVNQLIADKEACADYFKLNQNAGI